MTIRMSTPAALATLLVLGGVQPLAAQRPQFHPNRQKYSDLGAKPATGRSGSASLQARALLGKDGNVLVEASTGDIDAASGPGTLRKMQMKILSPTGKPTATRNFEGRGGGYWSSFVPQLGENTAIQLQANISGIDGNRTDVVTDTVLVKRRPDVAVDGVAVPAKALAGFPVNVVATVSERNGDMGAHADCMLQIDGQLADQARSIWIDAGHTVSCAFRTKVTTVGSHQVRVYLTGVSPTDYDTTDNAASAPIEIIPPETPLAYSASFTATDENYYSHFKNSLSDGSYVKESTMSGVRQSRELTMTATTTNAFSFPVNIRSALLADGAPAFDVTNTLAIDAGASTSSADCGAAIDGRFYVSVCNLHSGAQLGLVSFNSFDGRVTYFGTDFLSVDGDDVYMNNSSSDVSTGAGGYAVVSTVQPVIEMRDANGMLFTARPVLSLQTAPFNNVGGACSTNPFNDLTQCWDSKSTGTTRTGSATSATVALQ